MEWRKISYEPRLYESVNSYISKIDGKQNSGRNGLGKAHKFKLWISSEKVFCGRCLIQNSVSFITKRLSLAAQLAYKYLFVYY